MIHTSPPGTLELGFQQRILLSLPQLNNKSESCPHQAISRTPLQWKK